MAGVSYGLLVGVPLVAAAIALDFVLQRRAMVRAELLALALGRLLRSSRYQAAVQLCLTARSSPASRVALCLLALRVRSDLRATPDRVETEATAQTFGARVSAVRAALVATVQTDQRYLTLLAIVCSLTGALAGASAAIDPSTTSNGPIVLTLTGLLAAGFAWQRWRALHAGIALVGEAVERLVVPADEQNEEARAAMELAAGICRQRLPRLAALVSSEDDG